MRDESSKKIQKNQNLAMRAMHAILAILAMQVMHAIQEDYSNRFN